MALSMEQTRDALIRALADKRQKVVALSGAWGTGKTYLWRSLLPELDISTIEVSAFGAKSIVDLKNRLLQSRLDKLKKGAGATAHESLNLAKGALKKFTGVDLGDTALLSLPAFTRGRVVLIDDIERKQKSFKTNELLGFINEFSEKYDTRFVLILNSDKLDAAHSWHTLREKVIDVEICLEPTPDEAFSIASEADDQAYLNEAQKTTAELKITNIRILKKIVSTLNDLFSTRASLPQLLLQQTVPTITLMTAAHHRGLACGMTLEYIESFGWGMTEQENTPPEWKKLLLAVDFRRDELIQLTAGYLRTGIVNHETVSAYFTPRANNAEKILRARAVSEFLKNYQWLQTFTREDLRSFLEIIEDNVYEIDSYDITSIHSFFCEDGEALTADRLVKRWIEAAKADPDGENRLPQGRAPRVHPDILALKGTLSSAPTTLMPLMQAFSQASGHLSAESREAQAILAANEERYVELLTSLGRDDLETCVDFHLRFASHRKNQIFSHAFNNFMSAFEALTERGENPRLVRIIQREIRRHKVPTEANN